MKQAIILFLLLFHTGYGQSLHEFITKDVAANPEKAIARLRPLKQNGFALARKYYVLGKCYAFLNREDTALGYLMAAKMQFEKLGRTPLAKDVAFEAYLVTSSQENYDKYRTALLNEYYSYARVTRSHVRLAYAYGEFAKNQHDIFDAGIPSTRSALDSSLRLFRKAIYHAQQTADELVKAKMYTNIATAMITAQKCDSARYYLKKGRPHIERSGNAFELYANLYNYGLSYFQEGRDREALQFFMEADKIKLPYYEKKSKRKLYKKIAESYDYLDNDAQRRKYQRLYAELDKMIEDRKQNVKIHDINTKYEVAKKDRQLSGYQNLKDRFSRNKVTYGILLFLVFLLALYSFVRWKKVDYRKKRLERERQAVEQERTQAVAQLEKVKQQVIRDFIVLRDGSKLYLDNLIYIRADDKYLDIVAEGAKNRLIRGTLSEIAAELPPNFVKCHRSYIVNTNYIKNISSRFILLSNNERIPVSRHFRL